MRRAVAIIAVTGLAAMATACASAASSPKRLRIVVSHYPFAFVAEQLVAADGHVDDLTPPGAEPHDIALSTTRVNHLLDANLIIYLGTAGFQPAVTKLAQQRGKVALDVAVVGQVLHDDPHIWLDPVRMQAVVRAVATRVRALVPSTKASAVDARAQALIARLGQLDSTYQTGLAHCARTTIVTSHEAFGYLAARYGLRQLALTGIDPEAEPDPKHFADLVDTVKREHVTTVYGERLLQQRTADALARETGATTAVLDPVESPPANGDYFSVMEANLAALRAGLGCT